MQYPIIDNLIYAYQRNGWTGLEVIEGKNIFDDIIFNQYTLDIVYTSYNVPNGIYTMSTPDFPLISETANVFFIKGDVTSGVASLRNGVSMNMSRTIEVTDGFFTVAYRSSYLSNQNNPMDFNWQIERGANVTPYEPYAPPTTDIANRLKLPLPYYFPHPVIDALISAADGQHTDEEKEILRHYLTPLGIGGI